MRDIDGIEHILRELAPHQEEIEEEFDRKNEEFIRLSEVDHDVIGRVLKAHLVVETFLKRYLEESFGLDNLGDARLNFSQKVALLPSGGGSAAFVKDGIVELNKVRNKYGHRLDHQVRRGDLNAIYRVLKVARQGQRYREPIEAIEAFTPVACAFLSMPSEHLRNVFERAFRRRNMSSLEAD